MKINRKDVLLMYLLGAIVYFLIAVISNVFDDYNVCLGFVLACILAMVPAGFYFYRNPCDAKQGIMISAGFGFTITPVILPLSLLISFLRGNLAPAFDNINILVLSFLFGFFIMGIYFSVLSMTSYLLVKYLIHKPKKKS